MRPSQYALEMVLFERHHCKSFHFGLNPDIQFYLVAQNTEVFDELVEKAKAVEETLVEPTCFVVVETGKRAFNGASG